MKLDKTKVNELLRTLAGLPKIKEVKDLQKRLQKELQSNKPKKSRTSKESRIILGNKKRSSKQKRYWRYVKLIRDNFPNLTTKDIRSHLKERRQGKQVKISDAIWQNPSP